MRRAVVVEALRTPIGRAHREKGIYRDVRADDLSADVMRALLQRANVPASEVEDVHWGCVKQEREQGYDVARMAALIAGFPVEIGGVTVNRNCGSSLQAINQAAHSIAAECEEVLVAGGVEHMDHIPMESGIDISPRYLCRHSQATLHMGLTAENLAIRYRISRREQDEFALRSHRRAAQATDSGAFQAEIVPTWGRDDAGHKRLLTEDQCIRRDTSLEALTALKPAFMPEGGTVTAGNSSPLNVGAAAVLVVSEERAKELGLKPKASIRAMAVAGVDPSVMGIGPVPATHKALERAGLKLADIDLIEINEAFAAQTLAVIKLLGADPEKVNVRGGAIAIGHPLGASGARLATTLIHAMHDRKAQLGLATMCIGAGQGIATVFEAI
jgi:acetyl-CoA acyltransferase